MSDLRIDLSDFGPRAGDGGSARQGGRGETPEPGQRTGGSLLSRLRWAFLWVPLFAVVPFTLLLRGGVHAYTAWGWGAWGAIGAGVLFASFALGLLTWSVSTLLRVPGGVRRVVVRGSAFLALAYASYGLLHIAARNVKGPAVRSEYRALHPLLRLASTTLILADGQAVVTDAARSLEDYAAMGLPINEASLHFPQNGGYVHALDLRTRDRPEWRNALVVLGFRAMGFRTLRHVGTADHLHVSLPVVSRAP